MSGVRIGEIAIILLWGLAAVLLLEDGQYGASVWVVGAFIGGFALGIGREFPKGGSND